jgi:hypothetical protein
MAQALERMNAMTEAQRAREAEIARWMASIAEIADAAGINAAIALVPSDQIIKRALLNRAKALNLVWTGKEFSAKTETTTNAAA